MAKECVQLTATGKQGKRDLVWAQIRLKRHSFCVNDLYFALKIVSKDTIRSYLNALVAADYLAPVTNEAPFHFTLIKDCGVDAPRIRDDGSIVTLGQGNENMWRTMKILKTFSWHDLMIAASTETTAITQKTARAYVEMLAKAGYCRCVSEGSSGVRAVYRFVKNTGAKPPVIKRGGQLYDPNLNKVVYARGGLS